ncbi:branched-chain amino acid transport system II carrier protein [Ulvibacter litoralis]|uniref:Branched-chain amino acid:cation transporter, LIVCS family n=1 Tax=Ulvibacter litoralis TaxID=227084 RepID=A0A1G7CXM1_9FLAO|nr:branched-chain amino acid transport system II carrier protein [Ulvibacter litoralis]GHC45700.1 branched-chain amino acid transport system carrier protein [Ulvibacter litoralis]SDE44001.1 branched-chain amino acid:cation transporter, LIVCS family [Ulvibacter litoralis]
MNNSKQTFITAFALFSLFFGAGNLILPPFLGFNAGDDWLLVSFGFAISAVIIPILAIYGYARLQGTMLDFAKKVSPKFALVYAVIVYAISIALPSPRTASVTHEMAIQPYFDVSSLWTSIVYFGLVLVFVLNRLKVLDFIGKFLTPLIFILLISIIGIGFFADVSPMQPSIFGNAFTEGILEGYQTFDAIGGVVVGGVIVISLALQGTFSYTEKKSIIAKGGLIAGIALFLIYGGLIALGAMHNTTLEAANRTELLTVLSTETLGNVGTAFLAVLVALACFTTAVGIVTGTSDFVKGLVGNSPVAYKVTAVLGCLLGIVVGQFNVGYIIDIALPALMFIYPITIVLILLNALPKRFASPLVFRAVTIVTLLFSVPDFLPFITSESFAAPIKALVPLSKNSLGWVLPAALAFLLMNLFGFRNKKSDTTMG